MIRMRILVAGESVALRSSHVPRLHREFKFLGDTGVWRLLTGTARDLDA